MRLVRAWLMLLVLSGATSVAMAATGSVDPSRPLRVATAPVAPFVLKDGDRLTGFSVDFWNAVAARASLQFSWTVVPKVTDLLDIIRRGDADVAIAAIAITPPREQLVDFTHPYFNSGLQIMVHAQSDNAFSDTIRAIPWLALMKLLGAFIVIVFLLANVLLLVERRRNPDFKGGYLPDIGEALWGTMLIVATGEHGERNAPGALKRLTVVGMWLLGVLLIAQLTATVTSSQTVQRLRSNIRGPDDLPGKTIATVSGTVPADYLAKRGLPFVGVTNADDAIQKLLHSDVQAVVFGAPTLQYWVAKRGQGVLQVVGPLFEPERIGIAVAEGSPLRKRINTAMDELYEDGTYAEIYARWFGPAN
jgi:polar amino acid transport system substrate-binding protein